MHSALSDEKVSSSMKTAIAVKDTVEVIEKELKTTIDKNSISYARLVNHIKYMILRMQLNEKVQVDMTDYVESQFPSSYAIAKKATQFLSKFFQIEILSNESCYLAIHIERIVSSLKLG